MCFFIKIMVPKTFWACNPVVSSYLTCRYQNIDNSDPRSVKKDGSIKKSSHGPFFHFDLILVHCSTHLISDMYKAFLKILCLSCFANCEVALTSWKRNERVGKRDTRGGRGRSNCRRMLTFKSQLDRLAVYSLKNCSNCFFLRRKSNIRVTSWCSKWCMIDRGDILGTAGVDFHEIDRSFRLSIRYTSRIRGHHK